MRGRTAYKPDPQVAERVAILRAAGFGVGEIAVAIGVAPGTLRKYFVEELGPGAVACNAEVLAAVFRAATRGNMAAVRFWGQLTGLVPTQAGGKPRSRLARLLAQPAADVGPSEHDAAESPPTRPN